MAKRTFELSLVSLHLLETGASRRRETMHGVTAALTWPRVGVARKEYAVTRTLDKGIADWAGAPWHETILCRESVDGTFALRLDVTVPLTDSAAAYLADVASVLLRAAATAVGNADLALADEAAALFTAASRRGTTKSPAPDLVASGTVTIEPADIADGLELRIPLAAPAAVGEQVPEAGAGGGRNAGHTRKVRLAKGAPNGVAVVRFRLAE